MICAQCAKKDSHQRLGSGVHADVHMDRIIHNTLRVGVGKLHHARAHSTRARLATVVEGFSGFRPTRRFMLSRTNPGLNLMNKWRSKLQKLSQSPTVNRFDRGDSGAWPSCMSARTSTIPFTACMRKLVDVLPSAGRVYENVVNHQHLEVARFEAAD